MNELLSLLSIAFLTSSSNRNLLKWQIFAPFFRLQDWLLQLRLQNNTFSRYHKQILA